MSKDGEKVLTCDKVIAMHVKLCRILALLPFQNQSLSFIGSWLLLIYFHAMNTIYYTMYVGYGVRMVARRSFEIDYICEMAAVTNNSLRYFLVALWRKEFAMVLDKCRELWDNLINDEYVILKDFERKVHYYRMFFWWDSFIVVTMFVTTSQFVRLPPTEVNGTERRILPFAFYVDVQEEPAFTIISLLQGVIGYSIALILMGVDTIGPFFILMACGYLRSVQNRLLSMAAQSGMSTNRGDKLLYEDVIKCAKFHQQIMNYCEEADIFLRKLFLVIIVCCVYNISLIGLQILQKDQNLVKYIFLIALNVMQLFICQWAPQQLVTESEAVGRAAYFATLGHALYDDKANKILLLIMLRAQRPVQMKAGGYINLSIETFGHMMTNAFSFFTVARTFNQ